MVKLFRFLFCCQKLNLLACTVIIKRLEFAVMLEPIVVTEIFCQVWVGVFPSSSAKVVVKLARKLDS